MKVFLKKTKKRVVFMVVLAMMLQIIGPVASDVYAGVMDKGFRITEETIEDGTAYIDWEFTQNSNDKTGQYTLQSKYEFNTDMSGQLEIGSYKISMSGLLTVDIDKEYLASDGDDTGVNDGTDDSSTEPTPEPETDPEQGEDGEPVDTEEGKKPEVPVEKPEEPVTPEEPEETEEAEGPGETEDPKDPEGEEGAIGKALAVLASLSDGLLDSLATDLPEEDGVKSYSGTIVVKGAREKSRWGTTSNNGDGQGNDLGNIFNDVVIKIDGKIADGATLVIEDGMELELEFDWELGDSVDLLPGDFSIINLPDAIELMRDEDGPLLDEDEDEIGRYYLNMADNTLKVVFNDELVDKDERSGKVWVAFEFDLSELEDDTIITIVFETNPEKSYTIKVKPLGGVTIDKTGEADVALNANEITWTLDVNTSLDEITNVKVTDNIPAGLLLQGNIEIYNLTVGYNGDLTQGSYIREQESFPIELGDIDTAYRIIYKTTIEDPNQSSFTNDANITGDNVNESDYAKVDTPRGSAIDKSDGDPNQALNPEYITWTIQANIAESVINGAKVKDTIVEGLTLQDGSLKVYDLIINEDGSKAKGEEILGVNYDYDQTSGEMVINLGDIDSAYEIEYITDIVYGEGIDDYGITIDFDNTAILTKTDDGIDVEIGRDTSKATITRASIIEKSGGSKISPTSKTIDWMIKVNEAEDTIYDVWIEDRSGDGIEYILGSLKVKNKAGTTLTQGSDYTLQIPGDDGHDFKVILAGKITSSYTIEYSTKITDFNETKFKNAARISWIPGGEGPGPGEGGRIYKYIDKEIPGTIADSYNKTGKGINYEEKTMSWSIHLKFLKGKTKDLVIEDTFPNDGLVFMEDSLLIKHKIGGTTNTLTKGTHYTVVNLGVNYGEGFKIEFIGEYEDSELLIDYKTSFDPNDLNIIENLTETYINNANITGNVVYKGVNTEIDQNRDAKQTITDIAFNNGKKTGKLNRDARNIEWEIYVNYMAKDLTGDKAPYIITDKLSPGQTFDPTSLVVKEYTINAVGDISITNTPINSSKYEVEETANGFTLTFPDGIDKRYVVQFKTNINGISKPEYKNEAEVTGGNKLNAKVNYPRHNDFLFKATENVEGKRVWIDDQIDWKVTINDSLSDIEPGSTLEDIIGEGLVYVNDSLKIYKQDGSELESNKYTVTSEPEGKTTKLKVTFYESINEKYTVKYSTVVVTKTGLIQNNALFNGEEVSGKTTGEVKLTVAQSSGGTGSGRDKKGSIVINKIDENNETITAEAEFEVYYMLNGQKRVVGEQTYKTVNGKIEIYDLSFRTYFIREVAAPDGFILDPSQFPITVVVDKKAETDNSGAFVFDIENSHKKTNVTGFKRWKNGPVVKPTIELQLYRNGELYGDPVELENGVTKHTWEGLDLTDNAGTEYEYTVDEVKVPAGYTKEILEDGLTIENEYKIERKDITGTKLWVGGPSPRPTIQLQLYRNGEPYGDSVDLQDGKTSYTWKDLALSDDFGNEYIYTVDELNNPANYAQNKNTTGKSNNISMYGKSRSGDGLTVTNTYKSPKTAITGRKVWVGGESLKKPTIELQLYRNGIAYGTAVELEDKSFEYVWEELDKTDKDGVDYIYTIKEVNVPENYTKEEDGLTVRNTYVSPKTEVKGTKVWIGGPSKKPTIELQLYRNGIALEGKLVTLKDGEIDHTWVDLELTDENGVNYVYTVKETGTPENYTKEEEGLTVTNTYVSPKTEVTGTKVWIDGPEVKPTIELQLYRNGEALGEPVELTNGTTTHTWDDLDLTDNDGKDYVYTVDEVERPENYGKSISEDGLTITNTYKSPVTDITGRKVWRGGPSRKPTMELQLYRNGVALGEPVELTDGTYEHVWEDLDLTDANGKEYKYTIDEVRTPSRYRKTISNDGLTITNRYIPPYVPPVDPEDPDPTDPTDPPVGPEDPDPTDPTDPPVDPEDPDPTDPTDPPVDPEDPDPTDPEDPDKPIVVNPPKGGTVEFDEDGNWKYTPNPGFEGKDSFVIRHPDGREELIEINVEAPSGGVDTLPKTGEVNSIFFYLAGLFLIILGIFLRKRIV